MQSVPLLDELSVVLILAVLVTVVLSRLHLPTVAGLLSAGALLGPFGLRLVRSVHTIETLAEVGVVLLLFSIGLEFSLSRLKDIFRQVALGGIVQVGLTTLVAAAVAVAVGERWEKGIFMALPSLSQAQRSSCVRFRIGASWTLRMGASSSERLFSRISA